MKSIISAVVFMSMAGVVCAGVSKPLDVSLSLEAVNSSGLTRMEIPLSPEVPKAVKAEKELFVCKVETIHDENFFEESLSVEEHPDVYMTVDKKGYGSVYIGDSFYSEKNGDIINFGPTVVGVGQWVRINAEGDLSTVIEINTYAKVLSVLQEGKSRVKIADLVCKFTL